MYFCERNCQKLFDFRIKYKNKNKSVDISQFKAFKMKSLLKVLVAFLISQSVSCFSIDVESESVPVTTIAPLAPLASPTKNFFSNFKVDDELILAAYKIVENCDEKNLTTIFEKLKLSDHSEAFTIDEKFEVLQKNCFDKEINSKMLDLYDEVSNFFKGCIDPEYIITVEKLHSAFINVKNSQCKVTKEVYTKLMQESTDSVDSCVNDKVFEMALCAFEDKEIVRMSKNVSEILNFVKMLVQGNDYECGVTYRYQKCMLKVLKNCENFPKMISYTVKTVFDSFGCKINETTELIQETESNLKPLKLSHLTSLKAKLRNATSKCDMKIFQTKVEDFSEVYSPPNKSLMKSYNSICKTPEEKVEILKFVDEIAEDLKKCIDTEYVEYVDKVMKPIKRAFEIKCETVDKDLGLILDFSLNEESLLCVKNNAQSLLGCVFTEEYIREIIADSSKLTNFTMGLLGGEEKECKTFDQVQKCFADTFDTCKNNSTSEVFKYFSNLTMNSLECKIPSELLSTNEDTKVMSVTEDTEIISVTSDDSEIFPETGDSEVLSVIEKQYEMIRDYTFTNNNEV